jgi:hypothetical protein
MSLQFFVSRLGQPGAGILKKIIGGAPAPRPPALIAKPATRYPTSGGRPIWRAATPKAKAMIMAIESILFHIVINTSGNSQGKRRRENPD